MLQLLKNQFQKLKYFFVVATMKELSYLQVHIDSWTFIFVNATSFLTLLSTTTHSVLQICIQKKVTERASTTFRLNKLYKR